MNSASFFAGLKTLWRVMALTWAAMLLTALVSSAATAQSTVPVVMEGEALIGTAQASDGQFARQEMAGFGADWSGNAQLFWGARQPGAQLRLNLNLPAAGLYEVRVFLTVAPDFGIAEIMLAGQGLVSFDGYNDRVALREATLGKLQLAAGPQELHLRVTGKSGQSTGYFMGIDRVELQAAGATVSPALARALTLRKSLDSTSVTPPSSPGIPQSTIPPPRRLRLHRHLQQNRRYRRSRRHRPEYRSRLSHHHRRLRLLRHHRQLHKASSPGRRRTSSIRISTCRPSTG